MEKICFIINPKAGYQKYRHVIKKINEKLDLTKFNYKIELSKNKYDVPKLTKKGLEKGVDYFIAVGGDGTVNEICRELINSNKKVGVIPIGSGNGLALEMGITKNIDRCLEIINNNVFKKIDSISVNNNFFFNVAGIGYDALIAKSFSNQNKRGLLKYILLSFFLLKKYNPIEYEININNKKIKIKPFVIAICNSKQYGNNFEICPNAKVDDGKINICLIQNFSFLNLFSLVWKFYFGKIHNSKLYRSYTTDKLTISSENDILIHLDGESVTLEKKVKIKVIPKSINFVC